MSLLSFLLKTSRGVVALAVISAAISGAGGVALIAIVHAALSSEGPVSPRFGWAFAGLCVVVAATRVLTQSAMARIGQGAVMALCTRVCRAILALPLERFEAIDKGSLVAVLTEDVVIVANALAGVPQVCLNVPLLVLCFAYAGWLSPVILVSGALFAAVAVGSYLALVSPAMRQLLAARAAQDGLVGHFRTLIDGFRELRQHRGRRLAFLTRGLEPAAASVRDRAVAGQTLFALAEGWGELAFFGFLGFLVFALPTLLTLDRAALAGAVLVVVYVMGPLDVLLTWVPILARARTSLGRINALIPDLDGAKDDNPTPAPRPLRESVCLEGVTFDYPGEAGDRGFALGPVDLTLRPGEVVILAGGNGSGKTTLLKVLTGLYTPKTGTVRLDGRPVDPDTLEEYRQHFSVLFADGHLFRHLYGLERPGIEDEASQWLDRMELAGRVHVAGDAYSTTDLSQGQRGRLALLTACLEGRSVCVFDEWAANQDPHFKRAYYREILPGLRAAGKALLVISHDEDYYDVADRVVRLRDGRIVDGNGNRNGNGAVNGAAALAAVPAVETGERS